MTAFNNLDKEFYGKLAGMLIRGDVQRKQGYDEAVKVVLGSMKKAMPLATDEALAEFSSAITMVIAQVMRAPMQTASEVLQTVFDEYAMVTAQLIGAYDVGSDTVPNITAEEALAVVDSQVPKAGASTTPPQAAETDDYTFGRSQYL